MQTENVFTHIEKNKVSTNKFDLSHDRKLSTNFGRLTPIMVMDVIPGDNIEIKPHSMIRLAPTTAPIMHSINVYMHYFFVPNRIVWPSWEDFITGGREGLDNTVWPYVEVDFSTLNNGDLADYLGLPVNMPGAASKNFKVSAIPFAAYTLIYNEYYRDQNVKDEVPYELSDGNNSSIWGNINTLRNRAWQHDYFTSALPWTQRGEDALMPMGDRAPIEYEAVENSQFVKTVTGNDFPNIQGFESDTASPPQFRQSGSGPNVNLDLNNTHYTDLSNAIAPTINELRRALALQQYLELNARAGSRYTEVIESHFAVKSSDGRLQRPEYIGGESAPVNISEVLQTSRTVENETPQGNMSGHAVSLMDGKNLSYKAEEHGYIIGIMSVMPKTAYQQGIPRHFLRSDKLDYFWPSFAHIGEQPIYNKELYVDNDPLNEEAFGYIPRYSEYKYMPSTVHGDFRDSLDFWHMARKFSNRPILNRDFIECDPAEVDRVFAVDGQDENLWCHVYNEVKAERKIPYFSNPKQIV